jgi:hypothetical protein
VTNAVREALTKLGHEDHRLRQGRDVVAKAAACSARERTPSGPSNS